ncbi:MAG: carboxypeptidase-like regulatory domain-containing protein [Myxococcota bacterium]
MNRLLCAGLALGITACGGTAVTQVAPSTPKGTLSGIVTNTRFEPIEGVGVTLILGEGGDGSATFKTTTNAQGTFFFPEVPAGSAGQLTVSKAGFGGGRQSVSIPSQAGNFPLEDGNGNAGILVLMELNTTVRFTVFSASGKPAKGARGLLEVTPSALLTSTSGTYGSQQGVISVEAVADDNGALIFAGVPSPAEMTRVSGSYQLTIGALDEDGDGQIDSLGTTRSYSGTTLFTNPTQSIVLGSASTTATLAISAANLESLVNPFTNSPPYPNALKPNEAITVVFNQPIVEATRTVKVVEEDCSRNVAVTVTQRAPNVLAIAPTSAWTTGTEYHLVIRATGLDSGTTRDFRGYFFAIDPAAPRPLGTTATFIGKKAPGAMNAGALENGDELYVVFDTPLTLLGGPTGRGFIGFDLNGNGSVGGTDPGEIGSMPITLGFAIDIAEETFDPMTSTFTCRTNGYGSRHRIFYSALPAGGVPNNTSMRVTLPADQSGATGYQTAWGQAALGSVNGNLTIRQ